jgi:hypothetical protein
MVDKKFLNIVVAHIEGLRHPPIYLFETIFSCQCPFKVNKNYQKDFLCELKNRRTFFVRLLDHVYRNVLYMPKY